MRKLLFTLIPALFFNTVFAKSNADSVPFKNDAGFIAAQKALSDWKSAFNAQDAKGSAAQYEIGATMDAKPFGVYHGRTEIQKFWQGIIDSGFKNVKYQNTVWRKLDDQRYTVSSEFTMNKGFGVVHKELWVIQEDGTAKLRDDSFEVLGTTQ